MTTPTLRPLAVALALVCAPGLALAQSCPDPNAADRYGTYRFSGGDLYAARQFALEAGGNINILGCSYVRPRSDQGGGYVMSNPDFSFTLSDMGRYKLDLSVVSECDSILLINTGSQSWYYDDDDNKASPLDAKISLPRPANGRIDVWVGTLDGSVCNAVLTLETFNR